MTTSHLHHRLERRTLGAHVAYRSPSLGALGVPHAFTTRSCDLDVGPLDPDLEATLRRLAGAAAGAVLHDPKQVHGARVLEVTSGARTSGREADALVTARADALLLVRTADCVPVLMASADGGRVAAVHAGWRGLVAGVIPRAAAALGAPARVAAVGPCLSLERFEVGPEVAREFVRAGLAEAVRERAGRRPHVDLRLAATLQLERAGARAIDVSELCTWEAASELYSYRRDVTHGTLARTGRLAALVAPAARG